MIKTTKTDFKQKQVFHDTMDVEGKATFGGDAEVDGKIIVNSANDIVDKDGKPIIDSATGGVTLDTEQTITGQKHFKTGSYQVTIGGEAVSKPTDTTALITANSSGMLLEGGIHLKNTVYGQLTDIGINTAESGIVINGKNSVYVTDEHFVLASSYPTSRNKGFQMTIKGFYIYGDDKSYHYAQYPYHITANSELAVLTDINATTALTLTNVSGHRYTGTISTSNKVECIVDIDDTYTANFNIAKGVKTAFLMVYGTSSTDVATCFATMDSSGLVTIDLDNVSLSSFTPTCKYIIYN